MLDVNATVSTLLGMGEAKVVSSVVGGTMGREVFYSFRHCGPVQRLAINGCFAGQHSPSRVFGRRNLNQQID
jgi:hypothetical protein